AIGVYYYTFVEQFTIASLTIDCNVFGQLNPYVTCGAISLPGRHIRASGIRVINFGSHTQTYIENFVVGLGATHPVLLEAGQEGADCVIENCIAERPSPNPVNNSTIFHFFGGSRPNDGLVSFHRGCVIRNCFVNAQTIYGTLVPLPIDTITYDSANLLVTVV